MDYIKQVNEAINLFKELAKASTSKAKQTLLEDIKDNEVADKLLELLKDEAIHLADVALKEAVAKNEGRIRLGHFLDFVEAIDKFAGSKLENEAFAFLLRHADKDEIEMYKAILTNAISLPSAKDSKGMVVKESIDFDKYHVNPKAIAKKQKQVG